MHWGDFSLISEDREISARVRRLYTAVIQAILLYGAPIWATDLKKEPNTVSKIRAVHRKMLLRIIRGYITVSNVAAGLLAGVPPITYMADSRAETYKRKREIWNLGITPSKQAVAAIRRQAEITLHCRWLRWLHEEDNKKHMPVQAFLPHFDRWVNRKEGKLTYWMTQLLTGHGCFGEFLGRIGKEDSKKCHHCDAIWDDATHTIQICPAWDEERRKLTDVVRGGIKLTNIATKILSSKEEWNAFSMFCEDIMTQKEAAEREREPERNVTGGNRKVGSRGVKGRRNRRQEKGELPR